MSIKITKKYNIYQTFVYYKLEYKNTSIKFTKNVLIYIMKFVRIVFCETSETLSQSKYYVI